MKHYPKESIIRVVSSCCIIICLVFIVMKVSKDTSHRHLAERQGSPTPGLDYGAEWITELENVSAATGKTAADILCMRWNSRQVSMDFAERSEVAMFVRNTPLEVNGALTERQLDLLRAAITEWLLRNGNNDRRSYYRYLLESKETLSRSGQKWVRELALEKSRPEVMEMEPLQQLAWFYSERKCDVRWQGLVAEGTRIKVFETKTANLLNPGLAIRDINRKTRVYHRKTAPPISLEDALKNRGSVLVADLEVYIASDQGNIKPYFCRYWLDTENSVWRLKRVVCYPKQKDSDIGHIVS